MFSSKKLMFSNGGAGGLIRILQQPTDQTAVNLSASFTVVAEHVYGLVLTYNWQKLVGGEWVDMFQWEPDDPGRFNPTLSWTKADYSLDGSFYRVVISATMPSETGSSEVSVVSEPAMLTVPPAPILITRQPESVFVDVGGIANFSCEAEGLEVGGPEGPTSLAFVDSYEWEVWDGGHFWKVDYEGGSPVGNSPTIAFQAGLEMNGWKYRCTVGAGQDYKRSDEATLRVEDLPDLRVMAADSGKRVFVSDGKYAGDFRVSPGKACVFDLSHESNEGFPLRFSLVSDGTHGGGRQHSDGVRVVGTPGRPGSHVSLEVPSERVDIYYYCPNRAGMGGLLGRGGSGTGRRVSDRK